MPLNFQLFVAMKWSRNNCLLASHTLGTNKMKSQEEFYALALPYITTSDELFLLSIKTTYAF